ncbi:MAG: methylmalonyl-CoA mutase family protein, partial [Pseudomonadota bacterium]|nr:methylmalonyl-CoA mutase family protein [Pseudomonadota bacterium]
EAEGGMATALASGSVQKMIRAASDARSQFIAKGSLELTGVTSFPQLDEKLPVPAPWPLPDELDDPAITVERLPLRRLSRDFDALRDASDAHLARTGARPAVFLANIGTPSDFSARHNFARSLLAAGGVDSIGDDGFGTPEVAGAAFRASKSAVACLCSSDALYAEQASAFAKALKASGAAHLLLAGRPGEKSEDLRAAGIETFIYKGCDMVSVLREVHDWLDVKPAG